jgi:uncharacterized membrane protein YdjX (TVP38/TMEM64 family)
MRGWPILKDKRFWLLTTVAAAGLSAQQSGLFGDLSAQSLREHRDDLTHWVDSNVVLASATYLAVYVTAVALSIPCAVFLTMFGGFLFGAALGGPLAVLGATIGAAILFVVVRELLGSFTLDRFGPRGAALAECLKRDAASYLLAIRFAPVFPFFLVNLIPAVVGVPLRTYVLTTLIGVIPVTLVFSLAGAGLGAALDSGAALSARTMLTPEVMASLAGLAVLALGSIPVRRWLERRREPSA